MLESTDLIKHFGSPGNKEILLKEKTNLKGKFSDELKARFKIRGNFATDPAFSAPIANLPLNLIRVFNSGESLPFRFVFSLSGIFFGFQVM